MTKKEFFEIIKDKQVTIKDKKELQNRIKEGINELKKQLEKFNLENNTEVTMKINKSTINLSNGQFLLSPLLTAFFRYAVPQNEKNVKVRSKDIIVNNCYIDKKHIIIINNNTFTTQSLQKNNIYLTF